MTEVINKYHYKTLPTDAVYIGRGSKWGNPFVIGKDGNRDEVIDKYKEWIVRQKHLVLDLHELKGKKLACFCKPAKCHGDILMDLADNYR